MPYTYTTKIGFMESGIMPQPLEKSLKINKRRAMFIPDSRVGKSKCNKEVIDIIVTDSINNEVNEFEKKISYIKG